MTVSSPVPDLPDALVARPFTAQDAPAFFEVFAEAEEADTGELSIELADIVADWGRPSIDLARHSMGVWDGSRLVAGSDVYRARRADGAVRPDSRGRGIGTALARWTQAASRADGGTRVGQTVPAGSVGEDVLRDLGYEVSWTTWVLQLPPGATIPDRPLPGGFTMANAEGADLRSVHQVIEDAFNEWPEREPTPYEDWAASVLDRDGFEPWQLRAVRSPDGEIVAVCSLMTAGETVYVGQLATRADHRGRGLAQALLVDAFAAGREHGARISELCTDTRTGALSLYERLGMVVTQTWRHWSIGL